jgi:hypothetical protein
MVYKPTVMGICATMIAVLSTVGNSLATTYPHESIDDWIMEHTASFLGMEAPRESREQEYL